MRSIPHTFSAVRLCHDGLIRACAPPLPKRLTPLTRARKPRFRPVTVGRHVTARGHRASDPGNSLLEVLSACRRDRGFLSVPPQTAGLFAVVSFAETEPAMAEYRNICWR